MKKLLASLLLLFSTTLFANAYDFMVDGIAYDINSDGESVTVTYTVLGEVYNYSGLTEASIPETVTYNGNFYLVTEIGNAAFSQSHVTSVAIPNSVTSIDDSAFSYCPLTSVTIPNSVTSIGHDAFSGCNGLTSVDIGNSLTSIGDNAFVGCNGLTSVNISDLAAWCNIEFDIEYSNPLFYAHNLYLNGSIITNLEIPNSITAINNYTFYGCRCLTSVTIPNSVTTIGYDAFSGCSELKYVTIGNSVSEIYDAAFYGCTGLTSVNISDLAAWCNIYFLRADSNPLFYAHNLYLNGSIITNLEIPNSITAINNYTFYGCRCLTSVTIPNSVTFIDDNAFDGCNGLTSMTLIGLGAFDCYLGQTNNRITSLNIGSGITSLGNINITPNLIYCYSEIPPTCSLGTFANYDGELHVPVASLSTYFMADYWQNFYNMVNDITNKVTIDKTNVNLVQWQTLTLIATAIPEDSEIVWSTSNPSVATVDENGNVTATGEGECEIFATLASNPAVYACCHITSSYPEIAISISEESLVMNLGEEYTLTAIITPENIGLTPIWSSSNDNVATVENGIVTAITSGECDITATVFDKTATCHVTVINNTRITLNKDFAFLGANQMLTVYPSCTPDVPVELVVTSSDPSVVVARVVDRANAPNEELTGPSEKIMALNFIEKLTALSEEKVPTLASTKAIMIVGVQNGNATITVTTADGQAEPAVLELRVVDVDGDRVITASDITCLYNYLLSGDDTYLATSDVNSDGYITSSDITLIYNLLLGN